MGWRRGRRGGAGGAGGGEDPWRQSAVVEEAPGGGGAGDGEAPGGGGMVSGEAPGGCDAGVEEAPEGSGGEVVAGGPRAGGAGRGIGVMPLRRHVGEKSGPPEAYWVRVWSDRVLYAGVNFLV